MQQIIKSLIAPSVLSVLVSVLHAQAQVMVQSVNASRPASSIKGSGTTGQLPKWTSQDTLGDSIATEVNGNIGIGTATPGSKLTVAGRIEAFTSGPISALLGQSESGSGVRGSSDSGFGVFGSSSTGKGVQGLSQNGDGVFGFSVDGGNGVSGATGNGSTAGVLGANSGTGGTGVLGQAFFGTGVRGISSTGFGVFGSSTFFTAVEARSNTGFGVFGSSDTNTAIHGQSGTGTGVFGSTTIGQAFGVWGFNTSGGSAVLGEAPNGTGVVGSTNSPLGSGVLGLNNGGGPAGEFHGNLVVTGNLSKGGGSFRIDHPLDPENKYLAHSFVESPDMMNIYNGNVTTNENGEAIVTLPDYFAALNRDFRYQLTVIGQFAQAIVAEEITDRRFTIRTDKPSVKVSWQVTGVRKDEWANKHRIKVEEDKPVAERGYFLHPELYGQPEEKNVEWIRRPDLMKKVKGTRKQTP